MTKIIDAREASLYALTKVADEGAYVNLALAEVLSKHKMDKRDKNLATEITYGVMTYQLTLDWLIKQIAGRPVEKLDRPVLHALRIGFYQLFYLDRIPAPAAVYSTVELIKKGKKRALASFVNGVMRGALRKKDSISWPDAQKDPLDYLVLRYAHPVWLVKRWLDRLGRRETEELLAANNMTPPATIRVNTLRIEREQLLTRLGQEQLTVVPSKIVPEGIVVEKGGKLGALAAYQRGLFQIQGESAMLTSHILQPSPGTKVLDKTTPRLIQFHTLKNAVNPPFLGGFSVFGTVAAEAEQRSCQGDSLFSMILCNDRKAIVTE